MKTTVPEASNWRELLAQREGPEHFVIEGQIAVQRLLDSDYEVEHVFKVGENLSREEASSLLGYQFHRGYLAIARKPQAVELSDFSSGPLVILPEIADPGNLGTIIRNTTALGGSGVIIGKGCSPYNAKAVRASAGTLFKLPVRQSADLLADLQELANSRTLIGTSLSEQAVPFTNLPQLKKPCTLLFGPEDFGLSEEIESLCHHLTYLPMTNEVNSLNVAAASAIFLHRIQDLIS